MLGKNRTIMYRRLNVVSGYFCKRTHFLMRLCDCFSRSLLLHLHSVSLRKRALHPKKKQGNRIVNSTVYSRNDSCCLTDHFKCTWLFFRSISDVCVVRSTNFPRIQEAESVFLFSFCSMSLSVRRVPRDLCSHRPSALYIVYTSCVEMP